MIPSRSNWNFNLDYKILNDKFLIKKTYLDMMFSRTCRMFKYNGLPDYIPIRDIERILQNGGFVYLKKLKKKDDKVYGFYGFLGGMRNEYYNPSLITIANPYLKEYSIDEINALSESDEDGVIIWNNSARVGLGDMNNKYASLLAECDISIKYALVNARIPAIIVVKNDNDVESIIKFFNDIEDGTSGLKGLFNKDSIMEQSKDGIMSLPYNNQTSTNIKDLMEIRQYYLSSWLNELGISFNPSMKRETLSEAELNITDEYTKTLCDDMLQSRQEGLEKANRIFGWEASVEYNSSWIARERLQTLHEAELVLDDRIIKENEDKVEDLVEESENKDE